MSDKIQKIYEHTLTMRNEDFIELIMAYLVKTEVDCPYEEAELEAIIERLENMLEQPDVPATDW